MNTLYTKEHVSGPMVWMVGLLTVLATAACGGEQPSTEVIGSGVVANEQRTTETFTSLLVTANAVDAYVSIGSPVSVKVTSDDNIVPLITTKVQNDQLIVGLDRVVSTRIGMRLDVTMPAVTGVKAGTAVKIHMAGVAASQLTIDGARGAQITVNGQAAHISLTLAGGARADLQALEARDIEVSLSGASTAEVLATNSVAGEAHSISHLGVWGRSPVVNVQTSEGSTVTMMGMPVTAG